jgi:hypothetical protein
MRGLMFVGLTTALCVACVGMAIACMVMIEMMASEAWWLCVGFNTTLVAICLCIWQWDHVVAFIHGTFTSNKVKPSLIGIWLAAKKAKVCPLIEFVDNQPKGN